MERLRLRDPIPFAFVISIDNKPHGEPGSLTPSKKDDYARTGRNWYDEFISKYICTGAVCAMMETD